MPVIEKDKSNKKVPLIALAILVVVLAVCAIIFAFTQNGTKTDSETANEALPLLEDKFNENGELINPINWDVWLARNNDIYAWVTIPDTNVDLPILQHPIMDNYYLGYDIDGNALTTGALYTQATFNSKEFADDLVTVIYGHTYTDNDEMFTSLHNFEDEEFFNNHPEFFIYSPTQRYKYEIVSAFEYDNRHILETMDFTDPAVQQEFFATVQNPTSLNKQVRQLDEDLDPAKDKILILSTCTQPANDNARYLIACVLRDVLNTEEVALNNDRDVVEEIEIRGPIDPNAPAESE